MTIVTRLVRTALLACLTITAVPRVVAQEGPNPVPPRCPPVDLCGLYGTSDFRPLALARVRQDSGISAALWTPDGLALVTAGSDGDVRVWPISGNGCALPDRPSVRFKAGDGTLRAMAVSPDGRVLATGGDDRSLCLWSTDAAPRGGPVPLLKRLAGTGSAAWAVAFSPDGRTLASGGTDGCIRIWDAATGGERVPTLREHKSNVRVLAFSPDGRTLAAGDEAGVLRLWDPASGKPIRTLGEPSGSIGCAAFSADGRTLFAGDGDGRVYAWELGTTAALRACFKGHTAMAVSVAASPDGRSVATGGYDKGVRVWDSNGTPLFALQGHPDTVFAAVFSPDGTQLASGGWDGTLRLWRLRKGDEAAGTRPALFERQELEHLWDDLGSIDEDGKPFAAAWTLASAGDAAVGFLRERLRPAGVEASRFRRLIVELDDDRFAVREAASQALERLGAEAVSELSEALPAAESEEARARILALLAKLDDPGARREAIRARRGILVLERIGTAGARRALEDLAKDGFASARARAAAEAVERMSRDR